MRDFLIFIGGMAGALSVLAGSSALASCADIDRRVRAPGTYDHIEELAPLFQEVQNPENHCDDLASSMGRRLGKLYLQASDDAMSRGERSKAIALLDEATDGKHVKVWQVYARRADLFAEDRNFASAAAGYQVALDLINDSTATPVAPSKQQIAEVFKKAESYRLLAPEFVKPTRKRSGAAGGLAEVHFRNFTPEKVALPVEFQFDSVAFTPKGQAAAESLLEILKEQKSAQVKLIGHTDDKGTNAYNDDLSLRRAGALKAYLASNGFAGQITVEGRGKREPYQINNGLKFSKTDFDQLCRRVELKRTEPVP